jgi:two-component system phosphate regulon sensor histidine kinase PhoR
VKIRASLWLQLLGYGGAVILGLAAAGMFAADSPLGGLVGVAGALLSGSTGYFGSQWLFDQSNRLSSGRAQFELLQSQLEAQERAVDNLADELEIALFICDHRCQIVYANRRASELFDFHDPRGRPVLAVTLSHELERIAMEAQRTETSQRSELAFSFPKERVGIVKAWVNPEDPGRVFLSIYDITDLRRLERIRQDFVANVSHELRTPMTLIRSMAETLLDDAEPKTQSERYLGKIIEEVDRLSLMSQDLLILSAAESNPVRKHQCDIADVFHASVNQLESSAQNKGLELRYEGLSECLVEANTAQMVQVALNLIQNGINYTNAGHITVSVEIKNNFAEIKVEDTGIGIATEHLPRIFERFYRIDKGRSRSTGGTGLGLSIAKHIVEAHGGVLKIDSALNRGSTFTILLPTGLTP